MLESLKRDVAVDWVLRNHRKLAFVSGIGAAGILAYRLYNSNGTAAVSGDENSWSLWWIEQSRAFLPPSLLRYFTPEQLYGRCSDGVISESQEMYFGRECDRQRHYFRVVVDSADDFFRQNVMQGVREQMIEGDGLDAAIALFASRSVKNPKAISNQIKGTAFTRFIVALWTIPTAFLLCRLLFCILGRIMYMSAAVESIHERREYSCQDQQPRAPKFDTPHQQRLLQAVKKILPVTLTRHLYRMVHQVVSKHVDGIECDEIRNLQSTENLLSTINGEVEAKLSADYGQLWEALLGDQALVQSLDTNVGIGEDGRSGGRPYIEDIFNEARHHVNTRYWHVTASNAVRILIQRQTGFIQKVYDSVLDEYSQLKDDGTPSDDSSQDDGTNVYETGSAYQPVKCDDEGTVDYQEDNASEDSDTSAYDVRHFSSDPRLSPLQQRSRRLVAGGSLEPMEYSEFDGISGAEEPEFFSDSEYNRGPTWDSVNDSGLDTGEHRSFDDDTSSPPEYENYRPGSSAIVPTRQAIQTQAEPVPFAIAGIPFIRWATKFGHQGEFLFKNSLQLTQELTILPAVQNFCLDIFAPDHIASLPEFPVQHQHGSNRR